MAYHIEEKKNIRIVGIRVPLVEDAEENMRNVPAFWEKSVLDGSIVCTVNSFTSDEMKPYDDANRNDYDSHKRYRTVINSFSSERIKVQYLIWTA